MVPPPPRRTGEGDLLLGGGEGERRRGGGERRRSSRPLWVSLVCCRVYRLWRGGWYVDVCDGGGR